MELKRNLSLYYIPTVTTGVILIRSSLKFTSVLEKFYWLLYWKTVRVANWSPTGATVCCSVFSQGDCGSWTWQPVQEALIILLFPPPHPERVLKLIKWTSGRFQDFIQHSDSLQTCRFSPSGTLLFSVAYNEILLWEVHSLWGPHCCVNYIFYKSEYSFCEALYLAVFIFIFLNSTIFITWKGFFCLFKDAPGLDFSYCKLECQMLVFFRLYFISR